MNESDYIEPWWKRIGCMRDPGVHSGEEAAMVSEIKELREALQPDPDAIDYRELLKKYMELLVEQSGSTGVGYIRESNIEFTQEEVDTLTALAQQVRWS